MTDNPSDQKFKPCILNSSLEILVHTYGQTNGKTDGHLELQSILATKNCYLQLLTHMLVSSLKAIWYEQANKRYNQSHIIVR